MFGHGLQDAYDLCTGVLDILPDQCGHLALKASQPMCDAEGRDDGEELKFCDLALGEEKVGGRSLQQALTLHYSSWLD